MNRFFVLPLLLALVSMKMPARAVDTSAIEAKAAACRSQQDQYGIDWRPYFWDCRQPEATTLTEALRYQVEFYGVGDVVFRVGTDSAVCQALRAAGLQRCNYVVHHTLVEFLAMYGVHLFPRSPDSTYRPGATAYAGYGGDVSILIATISTNQDLLADGELTATEAAAWQLPTE